MSVAVTSITAAVRLSDGVLMPRFGLGVYRAESGNETYQAVLDALKAGYRHIDTAALYNNEGDVGRAIRDSGIPRDNIFVTTKVWNSDQGYEQTLAACRNSLNLLGMEYVDLYLIHSPVQGKRLDTWRAMEQLLKEGKVRSIGVSNYGIHHLKELFAACKVRPTVNQIELSPYLTREDLCKFCVDNDIVVESYSPLTKGKKLKDSKLVAIASKYGKSTAQVLIRWTLQRGYVCIPKSVKVDRIQQNADVFDWAISDEDMATLNGFDEGLVTGWNPVIQP